ncbi:Pectate lyase [Duganella sp. CF458]|uniref:pectate lyase family protein n=1 Tax=Duganella sp. CF458 TaxID=1884368 RepID=UPI0008E1F730|nr:GDSL-type esterase/lipase family protein [Duganella sp. CF458]SFF52463.1 Pectate lyase [Duganella sp. CF458]
MLRHILLSLACAATLPAYAADRIILVGDSTVASGGGYGDYLCRRQRPDTTCLNLAKNGRSSGSFRAEGRWDEVQALLRDSARFGKTYVLMQFGHNDQPGKPGRSTDLVKEYPANLARYVADVKAGGGVPVLVTSLTRRSFRNGHVWNDLAPWASAAREVAKREQVAILDLNALSLAAVQAMGPEQADTLAQAKGAGFDYTHLGPKGGRFFGDMAARELLQMFPALGPLTDPADTSQQAARERAPADGWAGEQGGTHGGATAPASAVYTVATAAELRSAVAGAADARIIQVRGTLDMADGAKPGLVRLPSHTTLIGLGEDAGFINASIVVANVSQVIIRNLSISNPCDPDPKWDPQDGPHGNWNSNYDGISVTGSHHVWIDHNSFTDAPRTDGQSPKENGMLKQCHDGALDITSASDFVTVSYNHFALHEKNTLVGASDRATSDEGHLRVSFSNNFFDNVTARAPRVRFGQVHLFNNFHKGSRKHAEYAHEYSVGIAKQARVIIDANAYDIDGAHGCADVLRNPGKSEPGAVLERGSQLNGKALADCAFPQDVGWSVPYVFTALPAADVQPNVMSNAGAGHLGKLRPAAR